MLPACASVPEPQVVIGRISRLIPEGAVQDTVGAQWILSVYEVRSQDRPDAAIFLIELVPCPLDRDHPEVNDPDQLYRIEYVSTRRAYEQYDPPNSDLVTTKCERV